MSDWRLLPDTAPLRESRSFRLLWIGQLISLSWSQLRPASARTETRLRPPDSRPPGF